MNKTLLCALSDEERRNYGIKLASLLNDIDDVETEKKKQADHYKDRIGGLQASADTLRHKVTSGQEWREVECTVALGQPTPDRKQIIRTDTGEVIETLWMTDADKQTELALDIEEEEEEPDERNEAEVEADLEEGAGDVTLGGIAAEVEVVLPERPGPLAEARVAGKEAHGKGIPIEKCPFPPRKRRKEAEAWGEGWLEAAHEQGVAEREAWEAGDPMPGDDPEAPVGAAATTTAGSDTDY